MTPTLAPRPVLPGPRSAVIVLAWFVFAVVAGAVGAFQPGPDDPPLPVLLAIVAPPAFFAFVYRAVPAFREFALSLDLRFLTAVQAWRVLGGSFLMLYAFGLLPALFAFPAGFGDMLVGATAVFALMALVRRSPGWQGGVLALNVLGLIDFAGAIVTGVLGGEGPLGLLRGAVTTEPLQALPLSLIPTFAVPLWIIFHVISLLQLRRLARAEREAASGSAALAA